MKKKNLLILYLLTLGPLTGCSTNENIELTFTQREYQLKSGEKIEVNKNYKNVKYQLINNPFDSISINEDNGTLTFDDTIPNYTQVMAIATYKEFVSEPCVVTLTYDYHASEVRFTNMSSYIVNNEYKYPSYRELSATALISAGWMHGVRCGYLDEKFLEPAIKAFYACVDAMEESEEGIYMTEISGPTIPLPVFPKLGYKMIPLGKNWSYGIADRYTRRSRTNR